MNTSNEKKPICANKECKYYDKSAIMAKYPSSVYCSIKCKYTDPEPAHQETYGD